MSIEIFTPMFQAFDQQVLQTITTGSAAMIATITPLVAACFSLYVVIVVVTMVWISPSDKPMAEFFMKMATWAAVIVFGFNITYYTTYVVPFFNGFGDQIAQALSGTATPAVSLDTMLNAYLNAVLNMWGSFHPDLSFATISTALEMSMITFLTILCGLPSLAIAAAYIIMAKFALGLLLAIGPLFIACALFPQVRQYFWSWVGQCVNYGILTVLFAAMIAIQLSFSTGILPTSIDLSQGAALVLTWSTEFKIAAMGLVFALIGLNLPSLASQLTGGVGISSMVGKVASMASGAVGLTRAIQNLGKRGGGGGRGGNMEGK